MVWALKKPALGAIFLAFGIAGCQDSLATEALSVRLFPHRLRSDDLPRRDLLETENLDCDQETLKSPFASYMSAIPSDMGLRNCISANIEDIFSALNDPEAQCSMTTILELAGSNNVEVNAFMEFVGLLISGLDSSGTVSINNLVTVLRSWQADSTKTVGFCNTMNEKIGPCVETLVPALVSLLERKSKCCGQLADLYELAKVVTAEGKTFQQTIFDIVNGLHLTMCSLSSADGNKLLCGQQLSGYLAAVAQQTQESSLVNTLLINIGLPLFALPDGDAACSALDTGSFTSRIGTEGTVPYTNLSCCVIGVSSLVKTVDDIVKHFSGNSLDEVLNLIAGIQDEKNQFASPYDTIAKCDFKFLTCEKPSFLLSKVSNAPIDIPNESKNSQPEEVRCTMVEFCDRDKVCQSVCEPGTATISRFTERSINFQRSLAYEQPLCFTQLPASHNSATTAARGHGNRDHVLNKLLDPKNSQSFMRTNNQFLSLTDQLNLGARFLEVDVHYFAKSFRSGHCSRISGSFLEALTTTIRREVGILLSPASPVSVEWDGSLLGCLPSLSGLRSDQQRLHEDSIKEIQTWIHANPLELVILYSEFGAEIATFDKTAQLVDMYKAVFGDLLFTPADLQQEGGSWKSFALSRLINKGKRVILVATPQENEIMFKLTELCDGWSDVPTSSGKFPGAVWGHASNTGRLIRAYRSAIHYATFSENALDGDADLTGSLDQPATVNATTLPVFVNAGVNILAPDGLDGATMRAMIWSWADKEPSVGDTAVEISAQASGRWYGVKDASTIKQRACVSSTDRLSWKVVAADGTCPEGFGFGAPRSALENVALTTALKAIASDATAQLNVDLTNYPVVSTEDDASFSDNGTTTSTPNRTSLSAARGLLLRVEMLVLLGFLHAHFQ